MMVVAEFSYGGLIFLIIFYEKEESRTEKGERREKERNK